MTRKEGAWVIREFSEIVYNRQRHHSRLGYLSPATFEKNDYRAAV
ncbi:IS3 family transposase [Acerihabitans sp. TG2]|nr:IS3 family transposase [Acerihabitans sp. TG2]MEA9389770.1 IS3 family transposase [Acerihabitans sp. TG2]